MPNPHNHSSATPSVNGLGLAPGSPVSNGANQSSPKPSLGSNYSHTSSPSRSNSPFASSLFSPRASSFSPSSGGGGNPASLWSPAPNTSDLSFFGNDEFFLPDDAASSSLLLHREPTPTISDDVSHRVRKTSLSAAWADVQGSAHGGAFASSSSGLLDTGSGSSLSSSLHVAGPSPMRKRKLSSAVLAGWGLDAPRPRKLSMSTIAALRARGGPPASRRPQQQQQQHQQHHSNGSSHLHHINNASSSPPPRPLVTSHQHHGKQHSSALSRGAAASAASDPLFSLPDPTSIFANLFDDPGSSSAPSGTGLSPSKSLATASLSLFSPPFSSSSHLRHSSASPDEHSGGDRSPSPAQRHRSRTNSLETSVEEWIAQYPILTGLPLILPHQLFAAPSPDIFLTLIDSVPVFACVVHPRVSSPSDAPAPMPPLPKSPHGNLSTMAPSMFLSGKINGKHHHHGHGFPQPMDSVKTSRRPAPLNLASHSTSSSSSPHPTTPTSSSLSGRPIVLLRRADESQYVNATTLLAAGGIESERERSIILSLERGRIRLRGPVTTSPTAPRVTLEGTWIPLGRARELAATCGLEGRLDEFLSDGLPGQFPELPAHLVGAAGGRIGVPLHHLEIVDDEVDLESGGSDTLGEWGETPPLAAGRSADRNNGPLVGHDGTIAPSTTLRPRVPTAPISAAASGVVSPPPHKKLRTQTAPSLGPSTVPGNKRAAGPKLVAMPRAGSTFAAAPTAAPLPPPSTLAQSTPAAPSLRGGNKPDVAVDTVIVSAGGSVVHSLNPLSPKYSTFAAAAASVAPSAVASPVAREQLLKRKLGQRPKVVGVPTPHSFYSDVRTRLVKRRESITGGTPKSPVAAARPAAAAHDSDATEDEATEDEEEEEDARPPPSVAKNPLARLAAAGPSSLPSAAPLIHPRVFHRTVPPVPATGRTNPVVVTEVQFDGTESSSDTSTSDELSSANGSSSGGFASASELDSILLHLPPPPPHLLAAAASASAGTGAAQSGGRGTRTRATTRNATAASTAGASGRVTRASSKAAARSRSVTAPAAATSAPAPAPAPSTRGASTRGRARSGSRSAAGSVAPMTSMDPAEYQQHLLQQQEQQQQLQQQVPLGMLAHGHGGANAYLLAAIAAHSSSESETESDSD